MAHGMELKFISNGSHGPEIVIASGFHYGWLLTGCARSRAIIRQGLFFNLTKGLDYGYGRRSSF